MKREWPEGPVLSRRDAILLDFEEYMVRVEEASKGRRGGRLSKFGLAVKYGHLISVI